MEVLAREVSIPREFKFHAQQQHYDEKRQDVREHCDGLSEIEEPTSNVERRKQKTARQTRDNRTAWTCSKRREWQAHSERRERPAGRQEDQSDGKRDGSAHRGDVGSVTYIARLAAPHVVVEPPSRERPRAIAGFATTH